MSVAIQIDKINISEKIIDTAAATGMATSEAAKLFGTFMSLGGLSLEQAENLAESTYQIAAQNGVAPVAVMKDISDNSKVMGYPSKDLRQFLKDNK